MQCIGIGNEKYFIESQGVVPKKKSFFATHFLAFPFRSEIVWCSVTNSVVYLFTSANGLVESPSRFQNVAQWMNFPFRRRQFTDVSCKHIRFALNYSFIYLLLFQTL